MKGKWTWAIIAVCITVIILLVGFINITVDDTREILDKNENWAKSVGIFQSTSHGKCRVYKIECDKHIIYVNSLGGMCVVKEN